MSLTFHLTAVQNRIFGVKERQKKGKKYGGVSDTCCSLSCFEERLPCVRKEFSGVTEVVPTSGAPKRRAGAQLEMVVDMKRKKTDGEKTEIAPRPKVAYDCLWNALSSVVEMSANGTPQLRYNRIRKGPKNLRIARKLKAGFKRWFLKSTKNNAKFGKLQPVKETGFDERAFPLLAEFLQLNICIFSQKLVPRLKICGNVIKSEGERQTNLFQPEYISGTLYKGEIYLLSDGKEHIKCILDTKCLSSKYQCKECLMSFPTTFELKRHRCSSENKFRGDSVYSLEQSSLKKLSEMGPISSNFVQGTTSFVFLTIQRSIENGACGVSLTTNFRGMTNKRLQHFVKDIEQASLYVIALLLPFARFILGNRVAENVRFLAQFEAQLNVACEAAKNCKFETDEAVMKYKSLLSIKQCVMSDLSKVTCFIQSPLEDLMLLENFMLSVLKRMCNEAEDLSATSFFHTNGKLCKIAQKGFPISFLALNHYSSAFMRKACNLITPDMFTRVITDLRTEFGIAFGEANTISSMGRQILADGLSHKDYLSMRSPPADLYSSLKRAIRIGFLSFEKTDIGPQMPMKSGISLDASKFYLTILSKCQLFLGKCLTYSKSANGTLRCRPTRSRACFANLLMLLLEEACPCDGVYTQMYGREVRVKKPVDAVMFCGNEKKYIQYQGCVFHGHAANTNCPESICHRHPSNIPATHLKQCNVCLNARAPFDNLRPRLHRFASGENELSPHPVRKGLTHKQVFELSEKTSKEVRENCCGTYIEIKECDVIAFFYTQMSKFLQHFGLPCKPEYQFMLLREALHKVANKAFPLLKTTYGYSSLNEKKIEQLIRDDAFCGFVEASLHVGPKGRRQLGILRPFSFKGGSTPEASAYSIENEVLSTDYLKFLLTMVDDVSLKQVSKIYEYTRAPMAQFEKIGQKLQRCLQSDATSSIMKLLLKSGVNSMIGSLNYDCTKYNKVVLCRKRDMAGLNQLKNFIKCVSVTDNVGLLVFKNRSPLINLSHLNYQIILKGKELMAQFVILLEYYTIFSTKRINTDGIIVCCEKPWPHYIISEKAEPSALFLDYMLRDDLTDAELDNYVLFKKNYFSFLGFCPLHENSYRMCLSSKQMYNRRECCISYRNNPLVFKMNLELIFDSGEIKSCNNLTVTNTYTNVSITKRSGIKKM